jgi:hypothetical protein
MRPATPLLPACLCVLVLAAGCSSNNKDTLHDTTWISEKITIKDVELPEGARVLEFKKDEQNLKVIYTIKDPKDMAAEPRVLKGKCELGSGDWVTLTFDEKLNDRKQHVEKIVVDGDRMTMTDSDGTSLTFKRAAKKED